MDKRKTILKIISILFLLVEVFILHPKTLVFADSEMGEETVQEVKEVIVEESTEKEVSKEEPIKEESVDQTKTQEEPQIEAQEEPQIEAQEEPQEEPQIEQVIEEEKNTTEPIKQPSQENVQKSVPKRTLMNTKSTTEEIEVATASDFTAVVTDLNTNGGSKVVKLVNDIALTNQNPKITNGELTILGEGHTLTISISVLGNGKLNLGRDGYKQTLDIIAGKSDLCIVNVDGNGELTIYDGVTLRDCTRAGQAGGITCFGNTKVTMYGGTITNCNSKAVAGAIYLDGHSKFEMYRGTISNCTGPIGGAVGLSGGSPIGPSTAGPVTFNMYGGTIENCSSTYFGGGAVSCGYSDYPVTFNMYGGTIKNCTAQGTGTYNYGGGAIYILTFSGFNFHMENGTIIGCDSTASRYGFGGAILIYSPNSNTDIQFINGTITENTSIYGGGIFVWNGSASITNGFSLYNNIATEGGDDIYSAGANVILGTTNTNASITCGHKIDGWYEDAENRWSYEECTGKEDYYVLFEHTGELYTEEYGLKAAHGLIQPEPEPEPTPEPTPIPPTPDPEPTNPIIPQNPTQPTQPLPTEPTQTQIQQNPIFTTTTTNNTYPIEPEETTEPTETIKESPVPKAQPEQKYWALMNLICAILSCLTTIVYIATKKKKDLLGHGLAIGAIILFLLTENITNPMIMTDKWTIWMIILIVGEIVNLNCKLQREDDEEK